MRFFALLTLLPSLIAPVLCSPASKPKNPYIAYAEMAKNYRGTVDKVLSEYKKEEPYKFQDITVNDCIEAFQLEANLYVEGSPTFREKVFFFMDPEIKRYLQNSQPLPEAAVATVLRQQLFPEEFITPQRQADFFLSNADGLPHIDSGMEESKYWINKALRNGGGALRRLTDTLQGMGIRIDDIKDLTANDIMQRILERAAELRTLDQGGHL